MSQTKVQLIEDGAVNSDAIENLSIDTIDIANGAVTSDKIADNLNGKGTRFVVKSTSPTTEGDNGDIWYVI